MILCVPSRPLILIIQPFLALICIQFRVCHPIGLLLLLISLLSLNIIVILALKVLLAIESVELELIGLKTTTEGGLSGGAIGIHNSLVFI